MSFFSSEPAVSPLWCAGKTSSAGSQRWYAGSLAPKVRKNPFKCSSTTAPWKMHSGSGTRDFGQSRIGPRPRSQPDHPTTLHALAIQGCECRCVTIQHESLPGVTMPKTNWSAQFAGSSYVSTDNEGQSTDPDVRPAMQEESKLPFLRQRSAVRQRQLSRDRLPKYPRVDLQGIVPIRTPSTNRLSHPE